MRLLIVEYPRESVPLILNCTILQVLLQNYMKPLAQEHIFKHFKCLLMLNVEDMHAEYVIDRNGVKKSVILPITDFYELLEDLEDLASVAERKDEPTISHEQVVKELKKNRAVNFIQ